MLFDSVLFAGVLALRGEKSGVSSKQGFPYLINSKKGGMSIEKKSFETFAK